LARVVLISSLADASQLPPLLKLGRATKLYKLVPFGLLLHLPRLAQWFFGARNGREYRLLARILRDTDPAFARWATRQLLHWDSTGAPRAMRLHGTHDRLLPAGRSFVDYAVPGAGHFMIVSHAATLSHLLHEVARSVTA
jgi:acetyl esterase/lipase